LEIKYYNSTLNTLPTLWSVTCESKCTVVESSFHILLQTRETQICTNLVAVLFTARRQICIARTCYGDVAGCPSHAGICIKMAKPILKTVSTIW